METLHKLMLYSDTSYNRCDEAFWMQMYTPTWAKKVSVFIIKLIILYIQHLREDVCMLNWCVGCKWQNKSVYKLQTLALHFCNCRSPVCLNVSTVLEWNHHSIWAVGDTLKISLWRERESVIHAVMRVTHLR